MSLEIGSLPIYLQPLRTAANLGASLGEKFRTVVDFKAKERQIQENQIDILDNSKNQLRLLFADNESQFNSLSKEQKSEHGKKTKELGLGFFGLTKEQMTENGKKGSKVTNSCSPLL
jgi:hypothetical protein